MPRLLAAVVFCSIACSSYAQEFFAVEIEELTAPNMPAVHSGAVGVYNNHWIFIGGRLNGLHGFQPPFAFPSSGINDQVIVYHPMLDLAWYASTEDLPSALREPLTSSNMQFHQEGTTLYMMGGYGYSDTISYFTTFSSLIAVDLPELVAQVFAGDSITGAFRQLIDTTFAVTGGYVHRLDSIYYLVWGQHFHGTYNVTDTAGFFVQHYTHEIRRFNIHDDGINLGFTALPVWRDTANFRRRDYNLVPQIFPGEQRGFTGFTGVFQKHLLLPHTNTVDITESGYAINNSFEQLLNQYHTAVMPVHDSAAQQMHTLFFGGTGLYYVDSITQLAVMDALVPFVKTISRVTRDAAGVISEFAIGSMPGFLGTNAHFIPAGGVPLRTNGIVHLNQLSGKTLVGYVMGGIESPLPNISGIDPSMSWASNRLFAVYINKDSADAVTTPVVAPFHSTVNPNPFHQRTDIHVNSDQTISLTIRLLNASGEQLSTIVQAQHSGSTTYPLHAETLPPGVYFVVIEAHQFSRVHRLVLLGD